uniref:Uncharacterized protein n=1 Tax=Opuntia streptacantha TaxID=393608 RepID=A0A7C8ZXP9_OPUST
MKLTEALPQSLTTRNRKDSAAPPERARHRERERERGGGRGDNLPQGQQRWPIGRSADAEETVTPKKTTPAAKGAPGNCPIWTKSPTKKKKRRKKKRVEEEEQRSIPVMA